MPAKAGIQYAAAHRLITTVSGILDHPLSRMMTTLGEARAYRLTLKNSLSSDAASVSPTAE
jgi:hypothetical protein